MQFVSFNKKQNKKKTCTKLQAKDISCSFGFISFFYIWQSLSLSPSISLPLFRFFLHLAHSGRGMQSFIRKVDKCLQKETRKLRPSILNEFCNIFESFYFKILVKWSGVSTIYMFSRNFWSFWGSFCAFLMFLLYWNISYSCPIVKLNSM